MSINQTIHDLLAETGTVVFSLSGGKDSDAMTHYWLPIVRSQYPTIHCVAVHADLGRAEWDITEKYVREFCRDSRLELHIVEHSKRDLLDGIRHRMETRPDAPPWPSAAARYCTSDWKRGPISKWVRNNTVWNVLVFMGLRAEESPARAKRPPISVREDCTSPTKGRNVLDVLPIHDWTEKMVWKQIGYTEKELGHWREACQWWRRAGKPHSTIVADVAMQFKAHPAYALGNHRLSCQFCVLADLNDLGNGAEHDPELYREYCQIEVDSGYSFRKGFWLGSIRPDLLSDAQRSWYQGKGVI